MSEVELTFHVFALLVLQAPYGHPDLVWMGRGAETIIAV
jgi:hypothetical protein